MKKLLTKVYEYLVVMLHPTFWIQLYKDYPYSESFDQWCRESLEQGCEFKDYDKYRVVFNERKLWIGNSKLCCFRLSENGKPSVQPSRYTKILMWKKFESYRRDKQLTELENRK